MGKKIFYGWIIVGTVFLIMFIAYAVRDSFPLFYVPILDEFGRSRAETALISSISFLVYGFGSVAAGFLLDRFGPRRTFSLGVIIMAVGLIGCSQARELWHIFLAWGIVFSVGMSAVGFVPCNVLVSRWFVKKRATALGIAQAGGRESFIISPLIQSLILFVGWRYTYLIFAVVATVVIILLAQLLRDSPRKMGLLPYGQTAVDAKEGTNKSREERLIVNREWTAKDWTPKEAMRTYRFWALLFTQFSLAVAYGTVMAHQVAFVVDIGFTAMFASFLLVIYGVLSMAGRLSAFLADVLGREVAYTIGCSGVIFAFLMLTITSGPPNSWTLYVFAAFFGLFSGLNGPTMVTAVADIFQGRAFGAIFGFTNLGFGLGNAVGRWFGGYIYDSFGNYTPAFITAMIMIALACISMWIASPRRVRVVRPRA